jgi:exopolysaccharide biosynthesis polyprenyl glycosylphosphotransferase
MGQLANIVDFQTLKPPKSLSAALPPLPDIGYSDLARLIPGSVEPLPASQTQVISRRRFVELLPKFCRRFEVTMLGPAILDAALIVLVFIIEARLMHAGSFNWAALSIFTSTFFIFALEEDLYCRNRTALSEKCAVGWALLWPSILAGVFPRWATTHWSPLDPTVIGLSSLAVLTGARQLRRTLNPAIDQMRNVLIVGSGTKARQVSEAIRCDENSQRIVKGCMAENHLKNIYGPSMLSRIAREEFIDEIIIASSDPELVEAAIQQACHNQLDVRIAPEIYISPSANEVDFENVGGIPLLKVRDHQTPGLRLTIKRGIDVVLALAGGIILSPLLFLIAGLIKLDSPGAALYRASRTGRKGRRFICLKFRTMVAEADSIKDELRGKNERQGAFFKIGDDPRITRIGRLLRRYSLDELPQLWNVLLGDMSLVGPRPHPTDDVDQYQPRHLQRLDFVPGMTGLWQVTARRDPSFERSVALDVEYIRNWNLWLDVRILCKTVKAVFEGSGV